MAVIKTGLMWLSMQSRMCVCMCVCVCVCVCEYVCVCVCVCTLLEFAMDKRLIDVTDSTRLLIQLLIRPLIRPLI